MPFDQTQNSNSPPKKRRSTRSGVKSMKNAKTEERFLGREEKRSLILAHSAKRLPVDHAQKITLWAGIAVCVLAIGTGWLYSVRLGIAEVFPADEKVEQDGSSAWESYLIKKDIRENAERMLEEIEKIEQTQMQGGFGEVLDKTLEMATEMTSASASSTANQKNVNLFIDLNDETASTTPKEKQKNGFALPGGVVRDNQ